MEYKFDFQREVEDFYRRHPARKQDLFFLDASSASVSLVLLEGQDSRAIGSALMSNDAFVEKVKESRKIGSQSYHDEAYSCIILNTPKEQENLNLLGHGASADVVTAFIFDHETGHMICDAPGDSLSLRESTADAYAVLRHLQRFGKSSTALEKLSAMRAVAMIFSADDGAHFTSPTVEKTLLAVKTTDISALTPDETIQLARRLALSSVLPPAALRQTSEAFADFQGKGKWPQLVSGDTGVLEEIGRTVLAARSAEAFRWGALAVRSILDGDVACGDIRLRPQGEKWQRLKNMLDASTSAPLNRASKPFPPPR